MLRHHHTDEAFLAAHAEVEALYQRLGHDVETLDDGGDPASRQALTDAGERYNTAGAQLGHATTTGELAVVRSIVVDGLHATRLIRTRQGLDPGPDPAAAPPPPAQAEESGTHSSLGGLLHGHGGLGAALGAGAAGGILGALGGAILGEGLGGGDEGWGDRDEGGWGGGDDGGGWGGGDD